VQEPSRRAVGCSEKDQDSSSSRAAPSYCGKAMNGSVEVTNVCPEATVNLLVLTYIDAGLASCAAVGCRANIKSCGCADAIGLSNLDQGQIDRSEQIEKTKADREKMSVHRMKQQVEGGVVLKQERGKESKKTAEKYKNPQTYGLLWRSRHTQKAQGKPDGSLWQQCQTSKPNHSVLVSQMWPPSF
jgi:hypothetical protein